MVIKKIFLIFLLNKLIDLTQFLFFLKVNSKFSNQFKQQLNLNSYVIFEKKKNFFLELDTIDLTGEFSLFFKEEPLMISWLKNFNSNDIFLDIGANVGTYTIPAISKGAFVYAFELDFINSSILFENLYLNKFLKGV